MCDVACIIRVCSAGVPACCVYLGGMRGHTATPWLAKDVAVLEVVDRAFDHKVCKGQGCPPL